MPNSVVILRGPKSARKRPEAPPQMLNNLVESQLCKGAEASRHVHGLQRRLFAFLDRRAARASGQHHALWLSGGARAHA